MTPRLGSAAACTEWLASARTDEGSRPAAWPMGGGNPSVSAAIMAHRIRVAPIDTSQNCSRPRQQNMTEFDDKSRKHGNFPPHQQTSKHVEGPHPCSGGVLQKAASFLEVRPAKISSRGPVTHHQPASGSALASPSLARPYKSSIEFDTTLDDTTFLARSLFLFLGHVAFIPRGSSCMNSVISGLEVKKSEPFDSKQSQEEVRILHPH